MKIEVEQVWQSKATGDKVEIVAYDGGIGVLVESNERKSYYPKSWFLENYSPLFPIEVGQLWKHKTSDKVIRITNASATEGTYTIIGDPQEWHIFYSPEYLLENYSPVVPSPLFPIGSQIEIYGITYKVVDYRDNYYYLKNPLTKILAFAALWVEQEGSLKERQLNESLSTAIDTLRNECNKHAQCSDCSLYDICEAYWIYSPGVWK